MADLRILASLLVAALSGQHALANDEAPPAKVDPLFADNGVLAITIKAPLTTLMRERPVDEELPAQLSYNDAALGEVTLDIEVRTRGRYRQQRRICPFAPLRLNFKKKATDDTLFRKTDKIKLVTHCRDGSKRYSQGLLREYLAYRIFNSVTERSFRVRLLRVTYVDTDAERPDSTEFAFLIESDERLAKRLGMTVLEVASTSTDALDGAHTNLGSVFQYLIGNTDFSPILGAAGEHCCHNYVLLALEGGPHFAVPYDLDMSGFVNAAHATPNPRFKLKNVRERLYRGRCQNGEHLQQTLQAYRERKQEILELVSGLPQLDDSNRKKLTRYIEDFYKTIDDPRRTRSRLEDRCI
ncbi:MAG: hypothetical protein HKN64_05020 [Woeseiaceae bacterium]|nr:hypothetical protein [Woeseiaceae bacterium]